MTEFDKLRALLDFRATTSTDPGGVAEFRPSTGQRAAQSHAATTAGAPHRRQWTRLLMVLIILTVFDAVYLLIRAFPPW
jgi:hypothetical protein